MTACSLPGPAPEPTRTLLQRGFVFFALAFSTAAIIPWLRSSPADLVYQSDGGSASLFVWAGLYGIAILALLVHPRTLLDTPVNGKLVWAAVILAAASALWSDVPAVTLRQAGELALTTVFAYYLATRFELRDIVVLLSWGLVAVGLASAAVALELPSLGRDHLRGDAWSGLFTTKNELGRVMALAAVVWLLRYVTRDAHRLGSAAAIGLSTALVVLSESKTALVVLTGVVLILPAVIALRSRPRLVAPGVTALLAAGAALAIWIESTPGFLARFADPALLTGRAEIWGAVWNMIREQFWLGYGLGAFWRGVEGPSALVWSASGTATQHAHNGLLDLWLALGLVGVAVVVAAFLLAFRRACALFISADGVAGLWPVVFLSFLLLYNLTESTLLSPNTLYWILFCVVALAPTRQTTQMTGAVSACNQLDAAEGTR
jgi:O-antigen ligase